MSFRDDWANFFGPPPAASAGTPKQTALCTDSFGAGDPDEEAKRSIIAAISAGNTSDAIAMLADLTNDSIFAAKVALAMGGEYQEDIEGEILFIDFEVFHSVWLCVIANEERQAVAIIDSESDLRRFFKRHRSAIFVGYNIRGYDQYIFRGILSELNPKVVNDAIIAEGKYGWQVDGMLDIGLVLYDVMGVEKKGLKTLEAYLGQSIIESEVDFSLRRALTKDEILETVKYCRNDVLATIDVFELKRAEFESHKQLMETFGLDAMAYGRTQAQLSATILGAVKNEKLAEDEIDYSLISDKLSITKYKSVVDWYDTTLRNNYRDTPFNRKVTNLKVEVCGVEHTFALGGLHGGLKRYYADTASGDVIVHIDVNSFYPAIMIEYGFLSRAIRQPELYRAIRDKRIEYKRQKSPLQQPYKIVLNSTYGISKAKKSSAYDPRRANEVCINGQLLLLDLLEHLENVKGLKLIQSNTDGLILQLPEAELDSAKAIWQDWESRTGMTLGVDYIQRIWQKDVNDYVFVDTEGGIERKGAFVKAGGPLDNKLMIVNDAIVARLVDNVPFAETIRPEASLDKFQNVYKLGSTYKTVIHDGEQQSGKVFRLFATTDTSKGPLYKSKDGEKLERIADTPEHCTIMNGDIRGMTAADLPELDYDYYLALAEKRYKAFIGGVR